jgi:hypothetical protein
LLTGGYSSVIGTGPEKSAGQWRNYRSSYLLTRGIVGSSPVTVFELFSASARTGIVAAHLGAFVESAEALYPARSVRSALLDHPPGVLSETHPCAVREAETDDAKPVATGWLQAFVGAQHSVGTDEFFNSQDFFVQLGHA